jgi:hypothetical protein
MATLSFIEDLTPGVAATTNKVLFGNYSLLLMSKGCASYAGRSYFCRHPSAGKECSVITI